MAEIVASKLDESGTPKSRAAAKAPLPRGTKAAAVKPESGGALKWTIVSLFAVAFLGAGGFVGYLTWSDQWSFEKPATGPTGPVPIRVPVDPTPVRPPPVDQNPVRPPPVDLAPVRPPPVDPVRIEPPPNPADPVLRFIRDYDGGDCFLAMPIEVTAKTAEIEAFAQSRKPFDDFDAAFTKRLGWEAMIDGGEVAPGHCAALRFARALRVAAKASPAKLEISKTSLKPGETLEGAFFSDAPEVTLLVVDDSGGFLDVTGKLTGAGPRRAFSLAGISKSPGARLQPMLALAIGSQRRIPSLRPLAATGRAELFATASREIESQGGPVEIAVKFFKLQ